MKQFAVLCADPPWQFGDKLHGEYERGAEHHYRCLSLDDVCQFSLPPLLPDTTLFLWRVASMQQEALDVIKAWGFTLKTELVWIKITVNGVRHFGMGRTVRGEHETCLIATRGKPTTLNKSIRSTFTAAVGRHSEKPEQFYKIVEALRAGPYCELFARRQREGWACLGDEL